MAWSHRVVQMEGKPAQILIDDRFRASAPIRELSRLAWIGVYCRLDAGESFWNPSEGATLDAIEDDLIHLCAQHGQGWAAYVMRISTRGLREYFIYFGGNAALEKVLPVLRTNHPDYRIDYDETTDEVWSRYTSCC